MDFNLILLVNFLGLRFLGLRSEFSRSEVSRQTARVSSWATHYDFSLFFSHPQSKLMLVTTGNRPSLEHNLELCSLNTNSKTLTYFFTKIRKF